VYVTLLVNIKICISELREELRERFRKEELRGESSEIGGGGKKSRNMNIKCLSSLFFFSVFL